MLNIDSKFSDKAESGVFLRQLLCFVRVNFPAGDSNLCQTFSGDACQTPEKTSKSTAGVQIKALLQIDHKMAANLMSKMSELLTTPNRQQWAWSHLAIGQSVM